MDTQSPRTEQEWEDKVQREWVDQRDLADMRAAIPEQLSLHKQDLGDMHIPRIAYGTLYRDGVTRSSAFLIPENAGVECRYWVLQRVEKFRPEDTAIEVLGSAYNLHDAIVQYMEVIQK